MEMDSGFIDGAMACRSCRSSPEGPNRGLDGCWDGREDRIGKSGSLTMVGFSNVIDPVMASEQITLRLFVHPLGKEYDMIADQR